MGTECLLSTLHCGYFGMVCGGCYFVLLLPCLLVSLKLNFLALFVFYKNVRTFAKNIAMNTISITVDRTANALMLVEWLRNIRFVEKVDIWSTTPSKKGNARKVIKMLNAIKSKDMLLNIPDPVAYQKQLRDEWER